MRKRSWALLIALLVVLAAGCGKYADDPKQSTSTNSSAPSSSSNSTPSGNSSSSSGTSSSGSSTSSNQTKQPEKPAYEKVNLKGLKKGDTAKIGPVTVVLEDIHIINKANGLAPGYIYILVKLNVSNEGDSYTINTTDYIKLESPAGKRVNYSVPATTNREPKLTGTVDKGQKQSGWVGFMTKPMAGNFKLTIIHPEWGDATYEFAVQ
jgi:hypothetical protein